MKRGSRHSFKTRQKMSKKGNLRWQNPDYREKMLKKMPSRKGQSLSEETKEKLRRLAIVRWQKPEFRAKMKRALKKRPPVSEETKQKMREDHELRPEVYAEAHKRAMATTKAKPDISVVCVNCNQIFKARRKSRQFCSPNCIQEYAKWHKEPNTICGYCKKQFYVYPNRLKLRKRLYCSIVCMAGDYRSEDHDPRDSNRLKRWRRAVLERDKYSCRICGVDKVIAHHILPHKFFPELLFDMDYGISLCKIHHQAAHKEINAIILPVARRALKEALCTFQ